jgi:hypothetical protein
VDIVTLIVAAEEDEYAALGESSQPLAEWSGIETPGIDTAKIVTLHCLLTGDPFADALGLYERVYIADGHAVVLRLRSGALERLQAIDDDVVALLAEELAASEACESAQWKNDEVHSLLRELAGLARLAESQGQALFVWLHPLLE